MTDYKVALSPGLTFEKGMGLIFSGYTFTNLTTQSPLRVMQLVLVASQYSTRYINIPNIFCKSTQQLKITVPLPLLVTM